MTPRRTTHTALTRAAVYLGLNLAVGALWGLLALLWARRHVNTWLLRRLLKRRGIACVHEAEPAGCPEQIERKPLN